MDRLKYFLPVLAWWLLVQPVQAADPSVHLIGPAGQVRDGQILPVLVAIDSADRRFNAAEIYVQYPPAMLAVVAVAREQSIFSLWPEAPQWTKPAGQISMVGGQPGGLVSVGGTVATIYFRALASGPADLLVNAVTSALYLHDGHGTRQAVTASPLHFDLANDFVPGINIVSTTHPTPEYWSHGTTVHVGWVAEPNTEYSYAFATSPTTVPDDTPETTVGSVEYTNLADGVYYFTIKARAVQGLWSAITQRRFLIDQTPPEPFTLVSMSSRDVGGAALLRWVATDRTSGIAESVLTVGQKRIGLVTSPLTLRPDWRGQRLTVTVYDGAGNSRSASWVYPGQRMPSWSGYVAALALLLLLVGWFWRRRASR